MSEKISCPNCKYPIEPEARTCKNCEMDLGIAALLAEREYKTREGKQKILQVSPEILVPRLGEYLIENGFISKNDLDKALDYQKEREKADESILLGQVLRELDMIDAEALDRAVTMQIFELQSALQKSNNKLEKRVQERTLELKKALDKLTELNQLKANFVSNISHELRTPLTHIKGYLDLLIDGSLGVLNSQQTDALEVLLRSEERLEKLIDDLIQFSLISTGELRLDIKSVEVANLIRNSINQTKYKAEASKITTVIQAPKNVPNVQCDEEKILWVIIQLIDNAIKFTPEDGRILIDVVSTDDNVVVAVSDTGIGIPSEKLDEVFETFHQIDSSATRKFGGTGLGLAMSNQIVKAHGSKFIVESVQGKGTRIEFSLPIDDE